MTLKLRSHKLVNYETPSGNKDVAPEEQVDAAKGNDDVGQEVLDELNELEHTDGKTRREADLEHADEIEHDIGRGAD